MFTDFRTNASVIPSSWISFLQTKGLPSPYALDNHRRMLLTKAFYLFTQWVHSLHHMNVGNGGRRRDTLSQSPFWRPSVDLRQSMRKRGWKIYRTPPNQKKKTLKSRKQKQIFGTQPIWSHNEVGRFILSFGFPIFLFALDYVFQVLTRSWGWEVVFAAVLWVSLLFTISAGLQSVDHKPDFKPHERMLIECHSLPVMNHGIHDKFSP